MKWINYILFLLHLSIYGQNIKGIYLSANDFEIEKLSFHSSSKKSEARLRVHKSFIKVKFNDSTFAFKKDSIFGYKDKEGYCYRFYNKDIYTILNAGRELVLYRITETTGTPKDPSSFTTYYFSRGASSNIHLLTLAVVLSVFSDNLEFQNLIDIHFRDDADLIEFDRVHKEYKLNRLLELSKKNKQ